VNRLEVQSNYFIWQLQCVICSLLAMYRRFRISYSPQHLPQSRTRICTLIRQNSQYVPNGHSHPERFKRLTSSENLVALLYFPPSCIMMLSAYQPLFRPVTHVPQGCVRTTNSTHTKNWWVLIGSGPCLLSWNFRTACSKTKLQCYTNNTSRSR